MADEMSLNRVDLSDVFLLANCVVQRYTDASHHSLGMDDMVNLALRILDDLKSDQPLYKLGDQVYFRDEDGRRLVGNICAHPHVGANEWSYLIHSEYRTAGGAHVEMRVWTGERDVLGRTKSELLGKGPM